MALAKVKPFAVEKWMDKHENNAKYNIAETCAASISLNDLRELSEDKSTEIWSPSTKLTYGSIRGSHTLRSNLANLYSSKATKRLEVDDILITQGAIAANLTVFYALLGKGDHVICHYPTYQQLYDVPASLGAEVSFWRAHESKQWQLDIEELKALIRPNTKMIIINNPHNPTGAIIPKATLLALVDLAKHHSLILHSDEVYRPLFHSISPLSPSFPPSLLSLPHPNILVTGSLSKAYSLAGIRVGWIASPSPALIAACAQARDYTTIAVSQLDDQIAAFALSPACVHNLLRRNLNLASRNLALLDAFVEAHRWACDWVKPVAGTTAFVKFSLLGRAVDDAVFCERLMEQTGVMLVPGSVCFGGGDGEGAFRGFVRFGFCCETPVLEQGLAELARFMRGEAYRLLPLAEDGM